MYEATFKRLIDVVLAAIMLLFSSPVFVLVALLIKLESRGPAIFKQQRTGKDLKPFFIYKFRSMTIDTPSEMPTNDFKDSYSYITKFGKVMRKLGLDELPQLINILKGEMSFVGPRPVILSETKLIAERQKYKANGCVPGITGWAQANGRDTVSIAEKARMDGEYAQHFGLRMDISCVIRTVVVLFNSHGYSEGSLDHDEYRRLVKETTRKRPVSERFMNRLKYLQKKYGYTSQKTSKKRSRV